MRPLFVAALALFLALAVPRDAAALSCAQRTRAQQLEGAKVVFVGKVTKNIAVGEARLATFRVSRNFKGTLPGAPLVVWYDPSKWQWPFRVGEEYLIFVTPSSAATEEQERVSPLWTFVCAGDILLTTPAPDETRVTLAELQALVGGQHDAGEQATAPEDAGRLEAGPPEPTGVATLPPPQPLPSPALPSRPRAPRSGCAASGRADASTGPWGWAVAALTLAWSRRPRRRATWPCRFRQFAKPTDD